jgi:hypothetical protein
MVAGPDPERIRIQLQNIRIRIQVLKCLKNFEKSIKHPQNVAYLFISFFSQEKNTTLSKVQN